MVVLAEPGGTGYTALSAGNHFTCAIASTGALECWGRNDHGQLNYAGSSTFQSSTVSTSRR